METVRYILQLPFRIPIIGGFLVTAVVLMGALVPGLSVAEAINSSLGIVGEINGQPGPAFFEPPGVYWGWVAAGLGAAFISIFFEWLVRVEFQDPFLGIPFKYLGFVIAAIAAILGVLNLLSSSLS